MIRSERMRAYVIRQGDFLKRLAHRMGFDANLVWSDASNAELREKRPNPEMLHPGDVLRVPDAPSRGLRIAPGQTKSYRGGVPTVEIRLALVDHEGGPLANAAYTLEGVTGEPTSGATDGDGVATLTLPVHLETCRLVFADHAVRVHVGHMDPVDEPSGVLKRLVHLGYVRGVGDLDHPRLAARIRQALRRFQAAEGLSVTGEADGATRDALVARHGS